MSTQTNTVNPLFYTPAQVAELLHVSVGTLRWWRSEGRGPRYLKAETKVLYKVQDVLDWVENGGTGRD
jgi:predicted site-specific integrase-resolvase